MSFRPIAYILICSTKVSNVCKQSNASDSATHDAYLHHRCRSVASGPNVPSCSSVTVPWGCRASRVDWTEQDALSREDEPCYCIVT